MSHIKLNWKIYENRIDKVERYCSNCGKKVIFHDSLVRRHNANGKKIFKYAIYKCENGHSWNKVLDKYNANKSNIISDPRSLENNPYLKEENYINESLKEIDVEKFSLIDYSSKNIDRIDILISNENFKVRLDKLLNENILDISRSQIQKRIEAEKILINDEKAKAKYFIKDGDRISVYI